MRIDSLSSIVASLESGKRPKGGATDETGNIPSLGGEHLDNDGGFRLEKLKYIDEDFFAGLKKGVIRKNNILIVKDGATTGKVSYVPTNFPFERAAINEHLFSLTVDSSVADPRYVFSFLRSPQGQKEILKDFRGSAIGGISRGFVDLAKIPLPLLDNQKRIAHLLGKVEGLISRRKQHLQQLDNLLKSVFLEMFGDPVRNKKGWEVRPCDKVVIDIKSGTSYGGEEKDSLDADEYGVLKISAVTQGYFNPREFKAVKKSVIRKPLRFIKKGDLLFSRANTIEFVGACCIVPEDNDNLFLPDKLWVLSLDEAVHIQFFNFLLKNESFRNLVRKQASGGHDSMLNISMKKFLSLSVPVPDEGLQKQFATIVEKVENLKSRYKQSLADLETLYGALSQKAFKGELDLTRVPLPIERPEIAEKEIFETEDGQSIGPLFELPAPEEIAALQSAEGRKMLIRKWLATWMEQLGDAPFWVQPFMDAARQWLWKLAEDEAPDWGVAEYDDLKAWVFEALEQGRLTQSYDDANNRVKITAAKG